MKRRIVSFALCCVTVFVASAIPVLAASGSDSSSGTIQGANCSGYLTYGNTSGTARSSCYSLALYRKSTAISLAYKNGTSGPYFVGDSGTVYNSTSDCSVVKSVPGGCVTEYATGSHVFEASNGYVTSLDTYA